MTTYLVPALEVSTTAEDGTPVLTTYKAGDVTPASEQEAQVLADLYAAGVVTLAAAKAAKSKPAAAEETE